MRCFDGLEQHLRDRQQLERALRSTINCSRGQMPKVDELDDLLESLSDEGAHNDTTPPTPASSAPGDSLSTEAAYCFPVRSDGFSPINRVVNAVRLAELIAEWDAHKDYMLIRDEYCTLSVALNHEGLQAPAFRPSPTIPFLTKNRRESDNCLHKDRIVIECHWLRCRHELVLPRDEKYQPLFDVVESFSFSLAESFACKNWSNKHRADEALILTTWQQSQLSSMQGDVVQQRRKAAEEGFGRGADRVPPTIVLIKRSMREWCKKDKRIIPYRKSYEDLWLARELLDSGASMNDIAKLGAMISGVPPSSERVVRDKLKRLDERK